MDFLRWDQKKTTVTTHTHTHTFNYISNWHEFVSICMKLKVCFEIHLFIFILFFEPRDITDDPILRSSCHLMLLNIWDTLSSPLLSSHQRCAITWRTSIYSCVCFQCVNERLKHTVSSLFNKTAQSIFNTFGDRYKSRLIQQSQKCVLRDR